MNSQKYDVSKLKTCKKELPLQKKFSNFGFKHGNILNLILPFAVCEIVANPLSLKQSTD
jgi:hypothetical protein